MDPRGSLIDWLNFFDGVLWNYFVILLLLSLGIYLTVRLKGVQFRYLGYSLKLAFTRSDDNAAGDISQFESLMTALAATIGIGSIAGVATAVMSGGFGAIFWMWVIALIGMATKYAEAILAVKYREVDAKGAMCGGPMYYMKKGLGWNKLGSVFAVCCILSAFAGGNLIQANSIAQATQGLLGISPYLSGSIFAAITGVVLLGGIRNISKFSAWCVPIMAVLYLSGGLYILMVKWSALPGALAHIFHSAFTGEAVCGGFLGATVMKALQLGISRGVSSNEAGLGSAPIAAAAAKTDVPGRQALISMTGVFLSSLVVCSITALVIAVTGVFGMQDVSGNLLNGAPLVMAAFQSVLPMGSIIVGIGIILFGYTTIVGWAYYAEKCLEFLGSGNLIVWFRALFSAAVFVGAILRLEVVWPLADIMNALMAFPNLLSLFGLSSVVIRESQTFVALIKREKALV